MTEIRKGCRVSTNDQGRRYYQDSRAAVKHGLVIEDVGPVVRVRIGNPETSYVVTVYKNCVDLDAQQDHATPDEVADAIESITKTLRRGK